MRHLAVEGSYNIRDLGGYPTEDGHQIRERVLIRAGNLDKVSAAGCQQLLDYGLKTIIDVRDEWEAQDYPNVFVDSTTVTYRNVPLLGAAVSSDEAWKIKTRDYIALHDLYSMYLDTCQPQVRAIVGAVAESTAVCLVQCYLGKDRTGLVAALILGAVGVPFHVIAADYAETTQQVAHLVALWREDAMKQGQDMQRFERNVAAAPETMLNTLNSLQERYGGVVNYLRDCGVTEEQLTLLRTRLIA